MSIDTAKLTVAEREGLLPLLEAAADWSKDEKQHFRDKGFRAIRSGEVPRVSALVRPTDYSHDLKRGAVEHHQELRNYSYHSINIPDGTLLIGRNFCQAQPNTMAILGKNLTFAECNLGNVAIDPTWTLIDCNTAQTWIVVKDEGNGPFEEREFICSHPDKLTGREKSPANVVVERDF